MRCAMLSSLVCLAAVRGAPTKDFWREGPETQILAKGSHPVWKVEAVIDDGDWR